MTISDEAVEAAAKAAYEVMPVELFGEDGPVLWEHLSDSILGNSRKHHELDRARAALEAAAPFIRAEALEDAADALDSDDENSFYETRRRELAYPYSKPMLAEQWGELDGIESAAKFLRARAAAERGGE